MSCGINYSACQVSTTANWYLIAVDSAIITCSVCIAHALVIINLLCIGDAVIIAWFQDLIVTVFGLKLLNNTEVLPRNLPSWPSGPFNSSKTGEFLAAQGFTSSTSHDSDAIENQILCYFRVQTCCKPVGLRLVG
jgi:hypothetical protein